MDKTLTINVGGREMTMAEINAMLAQAKQMELTVKAVKKEAKAKGISLEAEKAPKIKSAEYSLMVASFLPVIEANKELLEKLFLDSRENPDDILSGQDSVSFAIDADYQIIIRSTKVTRAKKDARIAKEKAKKVEEPGTEKTATEPVEPEK